jgi:hypothetical protein
LPRWRRLLLSPFKVRIGSNTAEFLGFVLDPIEFENEVDAVDSASWK